jgi:nucleoside-diphosphate-sugar epimerase
LNPLPADLDSLLESTGGIWEELRDRRIFITGGTGFVGSWLLESFHKANRELNLNARLLVLSRNPEAFYLKAPQLAGQADIAFLKGDLSSFSFPEGDLDYIIHAATESAAAGVELDPMRILELASKGTARVIQLAQERSCRKFLITSSGAVYGRLGRQPALVAEDYPGAPDSLQPSSAYAESKRLSEMLAALYAGKSSIQFKIARCFAFVGPYLPLNANFAIGNFIADALSGRDIQIKGDGTPVRSYLYASEMAAWLWTILFCGQPLRAYNVGSEHAVSVLETARAVSQQVVPHAEVVVNHKANTQANPLRYVPDTTRARIELGLTQKVQLSEAIARTLDWHRSGCR